MLLFVFRCHPERSEGSRRSSFTATTDLSNNQFRRPCCCLFFPC
jgi:hypothetical protein